MTVTDEDKQCAWDIWQAPVEERAIIAARYARQAAERERAEIVAWLRENWQSDDYGGGDLAHYIADSIEALAHKERKE